MNARVFPRIVVVIGVALALIGLTAALNSAPMTQAAMAGDPVTAPPIQMAASVSSPAAAPLTATNGVTLSLSIAPSVSAPAWGEIVTYTLVMRNTGDAAAPGAALTNTLPDGLIYLSGTLQATAGAAEYLFTPRTIRWQGDLAPGAAVTLTYAAQLVTQEYIYNTAVLTHPLATAAASATSSPADDWGAPEVIAEGHIFDYRLASYRNIAVDSQGRPRIAYAGASGLYYATFNSGVWTSVPVTTTRSTRAALVLDPQDRALIAFYDDYQGYIWLAREISPTANIWNLERVSTKAFGGNFTRKVDIQLDSAGRLHMVYYDGDAPSGHYYTVYSGTTWLTPTLAVASSTCAFALDGNDVPHLACAESVYLRLYTYDGSAWTYENVDSGLSYNNTTIYVPSLAYSGTVPHIAYLRQNNGLYYATRSGTWIKSQVDFSPWQSGVTENTPLASKVAVRGGQIAIAYAWRWYPVGSTTHTETVRVAYRPLTGTTWITESVDSVTDKSWSQNWALPALALTTNGRAHLAYYYLADSTLRHAAHTNSFTFYTVDESLELGDNAALDVDRDGGTHVAYVANGLRYAYSAAGSTAWTRTLAVAGVAQDALLDLAVDGANAPHVVYQSALAAPLYHATLTGGAWTVRAVDTPGTASYPALDADAAGTADVVYIALEGADQVVRYGHFTATTWTTTTLAIAGPDEVLHWQSPRLVAQAGKVYVLYANCAAHQDWVDYPVTLTLKTLANGVWSTQSLHAFTGQCNDRLTYYLLGDSAGRLAAVAVIADEEGNTQELTFWLAADGTAQTMATSLLPAGAAADSAAEVSAAGPQGLLGYDFGRYRQIRGDGLETLYASSGQKKAVYRDRSGAASAPVNLASTIDTYTDLQDLACYGQNAAALERSYTRNALAVERARPRPRPSTWANATKSATPAAVYAYERITYTVRLEWLGNKSAAIQVKDSLFLDPVEFVPNSLSWGPYINNCQYDPYSAKITCSGNFPASEITPLSTQVTYAVTPTCDIYRWGSLVNIAQVDIGDYHFTPSARTALKAPFKLRASSPSFLPRDVFTPEHTILLYTVPKSDEPAALWQECAFDLYVVVNDDANHPLLLTNDGSGLANRRQADFNADDLHYSAWFTPTGTSTQTLDLYAASVDMGLTNATLANTLILPPNAKPKLATVTDLRELFREFNQVTPGSTITDVNANHILDYYDAVERMRQYASDHQGVVLDVRQDAYTQDYNYYADTATRSDMGADINNNLLTHLSQPARTLKYLAIIGDDSVVPFLRLEVPNHGFDERKYLSGQADDNPTLQDTQFDTDKGVLMTDVPYGTYTSILEYYPKPDMGVGRIFYDTPLALIEAIAAYEQPIDLRAAQSRVTLLHLANEGTDGIQWSDLVDAAFIPKLTGYYGASNLDRHVPFTMPINFENGHVYVYDGATTNWNAITTTRRAAANSNLLIFQTHADHRALSAADDSEIEASDFVSATVDLVMTTACHAGYSTAYRQTNAAHPYYRDSLVRSLLNRHAAYFASASYGMSPANSNAVRWHRRVVKDFLDLAIGPENLTTGQAQHRALLLYSATGNTQSDKERDTYALYAMHLYGLPTQPILNRITTTLNVFSLADAPLQVLAQSGSSFATTEGVTITHFAVSFDSSGQARFSIPHQGGEWAETFGPILPAVYRTYPLPAEATEITVTLVSSQSHAYTQTVDLQTMGLFDESFGPVTGTFTYTDLYPKSLLHSRLYDDLDGRFLSLVALPLQHNPTSRQVTLYDNLTYRITYNAPNTVTVQSLLVNNGNPVVVGSSSVPVSLTLNSAIPLSGTVLWAVEDGTDTSMGDGLAGVNLPIGNSLVGWNLNATNWTPGTKHLWVAVRDAENKIVASGWSDFVATGQSLTSASVKDIYPAADSTAEIRVTVRDQSGAGVSGQSGNLHLWLDGSQTAATWQTGSDGLYTTTIGLSALSSGVHFYSVTLGTLVDSGVFLVDRQPPTSTLTGPAIVYGPTFTVTLAGGDDLSGVGAYFVQYRIGSGAWTDWLTRTTGWDYASGGPAYLSPTFGPTQPVALQPGQTVSFRTRAVDRAGNQEAEHGAPDLAVYYTTVTPPISYTLTVTTTGTGRGVVTPTVGAHEYLSGTVVVVTATAQAGSVFDGWSGACAGLSPTCTVTMDADKVLTATFRALTYTLTVNTVGNGTVTRVPSQTAYLYGAVVTLTATPDTGWYFGQWSGDASGVLTQTHVTMNANKVVTATFLSTPPTYYTLTMCMVGSGVVTPAVGAHSYLAGAEVELSATPAPGWQFDGWSGATLLLNPTRVVMSTHKTVTATFTLLANQAPNADAGNDQIVSPGALVTLDGSASSDPDGDPLTFFWRQTGGAAVSFTPTLSRTTFIAASPGALTFTLTVTDTGGLAHSDSVVITVEKYRIYLPLVLRTQSAGTYTTFRRER